MKSKWLTIIMMIFTTKSLCDRLKNQPVYSLAIDSIRVKIKEALNKVKNPMYLDESRIPSFTRALKQMCPNASQKLINEGMDEEAKPILGSGGFGRVLKVTTVGRKQAAKEIDLLAILWRNLTRGKNAQDTTIENCRKSFESMIRVNLRNLDESKEVEGEFEKTNEAALEALDELSENQKCSFILAGIPYEEIALQLFKYVEQEIKFLDELSKSFNEEANLKAFPMLEQCLIDEDLKVYLITDRLGPDLRTILEVCGGPIYEHDPKQQIKYALELVYLAEATHSMGKNHCDIKPENIVHTDKILSSLVLVDFGNVVSSDNRCLKGTLGYFPPEKNKQFAEKETKDSKKAKDIYSKYDVFSLGMILSELTMKKESEDLIQLSKLAKSFGSFLVDSKLETQFSNEIAKIKESKEKVLKNAEINNSANFLTAKIDYEFTNILASMMNVDYKERLGIREAIYLLRELHIYLLAFDDQQAASISDFSVEKELKNRSKLKKRVEKDDWMGEVEQILLKTREDKTSQYQNLIASKSIFKKQIVI